MSSPSRTSANSSIATRSFSQINKLKEKTGKLDGKKVIVVTNPDEISNYLDNAFSYYSNNIYIRALSAFILAIGAIRTAALLSQTV